MKKRYFKVYIDYTKYIPIEENELEKAFYAFQVGKPVMFENGAATRIESIIPDFNKSLGWSSDYKPSAEDTLDIDKARPLYAGVIGKAKERIAYLMKTGRTDMIGKNIPLPELDAPKT